MELIENVRIDLADYAAHPENYNEHPDAQVAELMESLRQFGQPRSIVIWRGRLVDGKGLVVAGHGVVEAARRLGWKHLDARRLPDDWPEYKVKAYLAADNELARGASPNMQALAALAEDVRRENETLARLAAGGGEALAELQALAQQTTLGDGAAGQARNLGDRRRQIKPVLYVDQIGDFERALRATGNQNRGEALLDVCRFYLEHHGETDTERQHDAALESGLAALAAVGVE